jgi:hypothetical protein
VAIETLSDRAEFAAVAYRAGPNISDADMIEYREVYKTYMLPMLMRLRCQSPLSEKLNGWDVAGR